MLFPVIKPTRLQPSTSNTPSRAALDAFFCVTCRINNNKHIDMIYSCVMSSYFTHKRCHDGQLISRAHIFKN